MLAAAGRVTRADHLAALVDREGDAVGASERAEVAHLAVVPEERVRRAARRRCIADDLATIVDGTRAAAAAAKRAEIAHLAVLPDERVPAHWLRGEAAPDHLTTTVVDRDDAARRPAERAELRPLPVLPDERAAGRDLAAFVEVGRRTGTDVSDNPVLRRSALGRRHRTRKKHDEPREQPDKPTHGAPPPSTWHASRAGASGKLLTHPRPVQRRARWPRRVEPLHMVLARG